MTVKLALHHATPAGSAHFPLRESRLVRADSNHWFSPSDASPNEPEQLVSSQASPAGLCVCAHARVHVCVCACFFFLQVICCVCDCVSATVVACLFWANTHTHTHTLWVSVEAVQRRRRRGLSSHTRHSGGRCFQFSHYGEVTKGQVQCRGREKHR